MDRFTIADAQAHFDQIIDRVEAGETVELTRDGQPVATISGVPSPKARKPIDFEALAALRGSLPYQEQSAGDFMREMRDDARY